VRRDNAAFPSGGVTPGNHRSSRNTIDIACQLNDSCVPEAEVNLGILNVGSGDCCKLN